jgi:hypothetical protein
MLHTDARNLNMLCTKKCMHSSGVSVFGRLHCNDGPAHRGTRRCKSLVCCPVYGALVCCPVYDALVCCPVSGALVCCPVHHALVCCPVYGSPCVLPSIWCPCVQQQPQFGALPPIQCFEKAAAPPTMLRPPPKQASAISLRSQHSQSL